MIRTAIAATVLALTAVGATATTAHAAPREYVGAIPSLTYSSALTAVVGTNATGYDLTYADGTTLLNVPTRRAALNDCDAWYPGGEAKCKTYRKTLFRFLVDTRDGLASGRICCVRVGGA